MVKITITMTDDAKINVEGFPDNKLVTYGMLAVASEVIADFYKKNAGRLVQPANVILMGVQKQ